MKKKFKASDVETLPNELNSTRIFDLMTLVGINEYIRPYGYQLYVSGLNSKNDKDNFKVSIIRNKYLGKTEDIKYLNSKLGQNDPLYKEAIEKESRDDKKIYFQLGTVLMENRSINALKSGDAFYKHEIQLVFNRKENEDYDTFEVRIVETVLKLLTSKSK